ncbi:alpha-1,3-mannosyl-glycoprotein 4-beta-N-acetylglucosaminyltransferase C-like [Clytia hemisphaerica]|uniref:Uncharacterized protein n=1 Tax=Clytia hemisphaerica TaxID=252671 RepID=A0A7M5UIY7_9CNID|eukprot:TCONS_00052082-protein
MVYKKNRNQYLRKPSKITQLRRIKRIMLRIGKLNQSLLFICILFFALNLWFKITSFYDCFQLLSKRTGDQRNNHHVRDPMKQILNLDLKQRVDLSIGIVCPPDNWYIDDVYRSITSITNQVSQQSEINTYIVFIGILATQPEIISQVQEKFEKISQNVFNSSREDSQHVQITYISISEAQLSQRVDSLDTQAALFKASKGLVKRRTHVNLLLSSLLAYGSKAGKYFLMADSEYTLNPGSLSVLIQEFEQKGGRHKLMRLKDKKVRAVSCTLYSYGRPLEAIAEYFYWMAPFTDAVNLMSYFEHLHRSHLKLDTDKALFSLQQLSVPGLVVQNNPIAMVTTDMVVANEFFPTNPYERGELFWTSTPNKGCFIIIKFLKLHRVKSIRIDTGINVYLSDTITKAVLEEANSFQSTNQDCGDFNEIADFRAGQVLLNDLDGRNLWTSCLRIRMLADEGHWGGIRLIQVTI